MDKEILVWLNPQASGMEVQMRRLAVVALTTLILLSLVAATCDGGVSGKYVNENEPTVSLLLLGDGTYELREEGEDTWKGVWEVKDDTLVLEYGGVTLFEFDIRGNKLIGRLGDFWVKE